MSKIIKYTSGRMKDLAELYKFVLEDNYRISGVLKEDSYIVTVKDRDMYIHINAPGGIKPGVKFGAQKMDQQIELRPIVRGPLEIYRFISPIITPSSKP